MSEKVAILDAGAQYGKVIDRKCREMNIESDLLPLNTSAELLREYKSIIISGGPQSVYANDALPYDPAIFSLQIPLLGICYGMQLLNHAAGGSVISKARREDGICSIEITTDSPLFYGLQEKQSVLMSHGDSIDKVATGFTISGMSDDVIAAIEDRERKLYGVQFHPEVNLTECGISMLRNFLFSISGCKGSYTLEDREKKAIHYIQKKVGEKKVIALVSGGVDSTVCAALLMKALHPDQIYAIHIDTGFMRMNESKKVESAMQKIGLSLKVYEASKEFYKGRTIIDGKQTEPLDQIILPEYKRKIIGDTFMRVSNTVMASLGFQSSEVFLAQGTLRPDLIESGSNIASSTAAVIKTHHNDTTLVRELRHQGRVIEPLQDYHKDEVRSLGRGLGLPYDLLERSPFPGPGLAIRILCAKKPYITNEYDTIQRELSKISARGIKAHLLPVQTVGVQGDGRSYSYVVGLSGERNWEQLFSIACEIPKLHHCVNRVVYIFGEPGTSTSITPTYLTPDVITQLQRADDIVAQELHRFKEREKTSQFPVISIPLNFGVEGARSIGLRPFITNDFMTGRPAVPGKDLSEEVLENIVDRILFEVDGVARVCYDLTLKPPGTTEWE